MQKLFELEKDAITALIVAAAVDVVAAALCVVA